MMKPVLFVLATFCLAATANAQISFGLRGGMHQLITKPSDITVGSGDTSFILGLKDARVGYQFGGYVRFGRGIYFQPELMFNSSRADYSVKEFSVKELVKNETYNYLDMPLMVGFKLGPLLFHGGPVGHYYLNSTSELTDVEGYEARFDQFTWGWAAGLGVGAGRVGVDLRYEGNFNNQGDHIRFFGDEYHFSNNPARLTLNVNFKIVGR
ncbi:MAG: PorT family protein [Saprospiraceae bacterium]|nr:PorT family protein [Saprospiraceae bacterium]